MSLPRFYSGSAETRGQDANARGAAGACRPRWIRGAAAAGLAAAAAVVFLLPSCSSGGGSGGVPGTGGNFVVLGSEPPNNGRLFLNDSLRIRFSNPVDIDTASLNSVSFTAFDLATSQPMAEQVVGVFKYGTTDGGEDKTILEFQPRFPTNDDFSNGGFKPARRYLVSLTIGTEPNSPVLRDLSGKKLKQGAAISFSTPSGRTAAELFRNPKSGGPRKLKLEVSPSSAAGVPLNFLSGELVEVRLIFDQALNPSSTNVPVAQNKDPVQRKQRVKGLIYLEYDDVLLGQNVWIPASVELELNTNTSAEVVLRPDGVLPNNADIRVIAEAALEDIAGESNALDTGFNRVFGRFRTVEAYESQFDAVFERFDDPKIIDRTAPFLDPFARVENGALKATFDFEGVQSVLDFRPNTREVNLNTDFTQVTPENGPPISVSGGVFNFRNVTIPEGISVRATGSKPMVWLVTGDFRVDGVLSVDGGQGARVDTLNSANFPSSGGVGNCTGGQGGAGSPSSTASDLVAEAGYGPLNRPGQGGGPGRMGCGPGSKKGSGGGGGSNVTQGDPLYNDLSTTGGYPFPQMNGIGGKGLNNSQPLDGGAAGPIRSTDGRRENDFAFSTVDIFNQKRIDGEFTTPLGGAGGGGGGDQSSGTPCDGGANFANDPKGGGGGGGAGVLIVKALGRITVGPKGRIRADGGGGGGGEEAGSNTKGGAGAGGAGGVVILMSGTEINLYKQGDTYKARNYAFSITADGGVSIQGSFTSTPIDGKYPIKNTWNTSPSGGTGGFGGMGVVQLMVPPGDNADGTNTILDDNIHILEANGNKVSDPNEKMRYIGWRGAGPRDASGAGVDDAGNRTTHRSGDIRPEPELMPTPFSRYSRARTRWIWSGLTDRRELTLADGAPRGIVGSAGPEYFFAGTFTDSGNRDGWVDFENGSGIIRYPVALSGIAVTSVSPQGGTFEGRTVHKLTVGAGALGSLDHRYKNHRAILKDSLGTAVGELRVLGHVGNEVFLDPADGILAAGSKTMDLIAKFFEVRTNGTPGLGPLYAPNIQDPTKKIPIANLQIGFAFHQDPASPDLSQPRKDLKRYPQDLGTFIYDLVSPAAKETLRNLHYSYVQMDVRYNIDYTDNNPGRNSGPNRPGPGSPLPELSSLSLLYRF